jgi:hypothetical protein
MLQVSATAGMSIVSPLGIDFGQASNLVSLTIPLNSTYVTSSTYVNAKFGGSGTAGVTHGAPTIGNSFITINTAQTDYFDTQIVDTGGDLTCFIVIMNTDTLAGAGTQFIGLSNYGADPGDPVTGYKGMSFVATSTTTVKVADYWNISGTESVGNANLTVSNLINTWHCYCFTRATVAGTSTITLYDLTTSGTTAPVSKANAGSVIVNNESVTFRIGTNSNFGTNGGKCEIALVDLTQGAYLSGAALSVAQINQKYQMIKAFCAALPSPITV